MKTITRAKFGILSRRQFEALVRAFSTCEDVVLVEDKIIADAISADAIRTDANSEALDADAVPGPSNLRDPEEVHKAVEHLCQAHNLIMDADPVHNASDRFRNHYFQIRRAR